MFPLFPKFRGSGALLALIVPLLITSAGCNRYSRTKQCRALIAQINPAIDEVTALTHGGAGSSSGSFVAAAGRYERLAKQLGPMEFASEDMAKLVAEYAGLLTTSALDLRNLATAIDSNNTIESDRINRELERISAHERTVVGRMDAWCQP